MGMFLIIAGCIWVGLAAIFVLALMCAARRRVPSPNPELPQHASATVNAQDSPLTPPATEERGIDPVMEV